jgi:hypothetical protein
MSTHHAHLLLLSTAQPAVRKDLQKRGLPIDCAVRALNDLVQFAHLRAMIHDAAL